MEKEKSLITGTAKFSEPTICLCECLITSEVKDQVTMKLTPKNEYFAARAGFAVVLITPDDYGYPKSKADQKKYRARQNVM